MEKHEKAICLFLTAAVFIMLYVMFLYTDFFADDLVYMNQWESSEKLSSIQDIIYFQKQHYLTWGGRTMAHTILQLLFLMPKPVSALLNTVCFFGLAYLMCLCAFGKNFSFRYMCLTLGMLYYLNPYFEETVHWYTGFANYGWMTLLILLTACPFFSYLNKPGYKPGYIQYLLLPLSLLGGWTNENMAPSMVLFMMGCVFLMLKDKNKVPVYYYLSILFCTAGCALLILAPGNYARSAGFGSGLMSLAYRGHGQVNAWADWLFLPLITAGILLYCSRRIHKFNTSEKRYVFLTAGWFAVSVLVMVMSPSYPQRATFGSFVLLAVMILHSAKRIYDHDEGSRVLIRNLCMITALGFIMVLLSIDVLAAVRSMGVYIPN